MKYIEELNPGSIFQFKKNNYVLGVDFKYQQTSTKRMCVNITNGQVSWFRSDEIVDYLDLYYRDEDGNILPIKLLS
jgi:hypothetical protein